MKLAIISRVLAVLQLSVALYAIAATAGVASPPRVDHGIHRTLQRQGTVNLMVTMKDGTRPVLERLRRQEQAASTFSQSRGDKITAMVAELQAHTAASQAGITALLARESSTSSTKLASEVRRFWITNKIYFRDATYELVKKLGSVPGILSMDEARILPVPTLLHQTAAVANTNTTEATRISANGGEPQWGVAKIRAPAVWATGATGQGVVVGSIDSGVRATHAVLRGKFRKEFGWYDPDTKSAEPFDDNGHGTYTMGSLVGANGYGVAPGAQWITCKAVRPGGYFDLDIYACAEFLTCPTDPTGTIRDCSKAPHIINVELSGGQGLTGFPDATAVWAQLGITAIYAAGNKGPACGTVESPGDAENRISVGATDASDALASYSSRGPSVFGRMEPEVVAPGSDIVSSASGGDDSYTQASGTSAAMPHVAGVVALMLSVKPGLTPDQVRDVLQSTAVRTTLKPTGQTCGGSVDGVFPNNMYGHGRVDALAAVESLRPRAPGQCAGLDAASCVRVFFCTVDWLDKKCVRWW